MLRHGLVRTTCRQCLHFQYNAFSYIHPLIRNRFPASPVQVPKRQNGTAIRGRLLKSSRESILRLEYTSKVFPPPSPSTSHHRTPRLTSQPRHNHLQPQKGRHRHNRRLVRRTHETRPLVQRHPTQCTPLLPDPISTSFITPHSPSPPLPPANPPT